MQDLTRRALLLGSGAALGATAVGLSRSDLPKVTPHLSIPPQSGQTILNDASELSLTPVHRHITMTEDMGDALVTRIRAEMRDAAEAGRPVNIGAARRSMGGQSIPRDGHAITFDNAGLELDSATGIYRAHAGARWADVIRALDPQGFSPQVMQSNNDFGLAATFCVNAHGWAVPFGPMGATVQAIEMITPDGTRLRCSRTEEAELFRMTMGGYGLTGAIIALEVSAAENLRLVPSFQAMHAARFAPTFMAAARDSGVNMAYGRLNVDHENFFEEAFLVTYRPDPDQEALPPASGSGWTAHVASRVYRAQLGREWARKLRWWFETELGPVVGGGAVTRNSLINEPVATLDDRNPARTDILHEYFVPPERFPDFLEICRAVIPASYQQFLNVTLRFVDSDPESWLAYAPEPRIAAVMSFSQEKTARAEADMARMTQALIDGMREIGGSYYLPYRPHARPDQFRDIYPRAQAFADAKRALDPRLLFRNNLWDQYLEPL